jgi:hypothetical protein
LGASPQNSTYIRPAECRPFESLEKKMSSSNEIPPTISQPCIIDSISACAGPEADYTRLNTKQRGELAELLFAVEALSRRFGVSRPYGESEPYDCNVISPKKHNGKPKTSRVQVRAVFTIARVGSERKIKAYIITLHKTHTRHRRLADEFDFLAAYVAPLDAWYIIPVKELGTRWSLIVYPHREASKRHKFEKFRDRWDLLE